ncbi:MAG: ASCH domain-containing protein [Vulcanimicrobiaceae bacterium]
MICEKKFKALTICQPYAHMIIRREKFVENRTWPTSYRGPLLIHAGKSRQWLYAGDEDKYKGLGDPMAFGAIVGVVTLTDVLHITKIEHDARLSWLRTHEHTEGPWCWVLADVVRLERPVPWKGAQGLWEDRGLDEIMSMKEPKP